MASVKTQFFRFSLQQYKKFDLCKAFDCFSLLCYFLYSSSDLDPLLRRSDECRRVADQLRLIEATDLLQTFLKLIIFDFRQQQ